MDTFDMQVFNLLSIARPGTMMLGVPLFDPPSIKECESRLLVLLRRGGVRSRNKQARLVEAMAGKTQAIHEDISEYVYGDESEGNEESFRGLARQVSWWARKNEIPLIYTSRSGRVYKDRA